MLATASPSVFSSWFQQFTQRPIQLLAKLSTAHFMIDSLGGFMLPILPLLSKALGFGLVETGFILTVSSITSSVLQPLWGWLFERITRVNVILIGFYV